MNVIERVRTAHNNSHAGACRVFAAPGRVNLIGEHTDYNDGFVLPMAIERVTVAAVTPNDTDIVRIDSLDLGETASIALERPFERVNSWRDYAAAVVAAVQEDVPLHHGLDITVGSSVPIGAGLASSAAFEVALAQALFSFTAAEVNPERLAAIGRRAEHDYVGIRSGVMDQLTCTLAQTGCALSIDCRTHKTLPIALPADARVLVLDSGVKRALASSQYNERRAECERAVKELRRSGLDIDSLRDLSIELFHKNASALSPTAFKRAKHVVEENARTKDAVAALTIGDLGSLGRLMNDSHASLRDLYEVSTPQLDHLTSIARSTSGVFGARMTGGGFGGSAIVLVAEDAAAFALHEILDKYATYDRVESIGFVTTATEGAREIL